MKQRFAERVLALLQSRGVTSVRIGVINDKGTWIVDVQTQEVVDAIAAIDPTVVMSAIEAEEADERDRQAWLKIAKNYVDDGIQDAKDVAKTYADSTFAKQTDAQAIYNALVTLKARYDKLEAAWVARFGPLA